MFCDENKASETASFRSKHILITYQSALHFVEAFVEAQVVTDGVFPADRCLAIVRKVLLDPGVDVADRQCFSWRRLDGQEDESGEGVRRLRERLGLPSSSSFIGRRQL